MDRIALYLHGMGGNAAEAEHYRPLFHDTDVIGFDYKASTPWEAKAEFAAFAAPLIRKYSKVMLIANSIGAYFAMQALIGARIDRAFFISPIADMEHLIIDMMNLAGVTEDELRQKQRIQTAYGYELSWEYLCYARDNPVNWEQPSHILYGEHDQLTDYSTISELARRTGADLTVMNGGEHWFHTDDQMHFLDNWIAGIMEREER